MKKQLIIIGIVSILVTVGLSGCNEQPKLSITNHRIQKLINAASDGDTISVSNGTYYENIIINKSIILRGEDRNTTVINGSEGNVVLIIADNCTFEGFKVINTGGTKTTFGIIINATNTTITNNTISSNTYGISFNHSSKDNTIFYNNISNNTYGLYFSTSSEKNIVDSNIFFNNDKGIYMTHSHLNVIVMNNMSYGEYGISLSSSENNTITDNNIFSNKQYGIYLDSESRNNLLQLNTISFNLLGIRIKTSHFNTITKNIIQYNTEGVLTCCGSNNNTIYKNIIKNNSNWNAENNNFNQWDYKGFGNFWDDYTGIDSNNDGKGDTPYTFIGGTDNNPLTNTSWINKP